MAILIALLFIAAVSLFIILVLAGCGLMAVATIGSALKGPHA